MKRRIARLLEEGVDPNRILAVTFTRVASNNLIKELLELGIEGSENIRASTLHSFCFSVLMKGDVFEYIDRVPRPLISFDKVGVTQFEIAPLLIDLQKQSQYGNKRNKTKRIKAFEADWARLQSEEPGWPTTKVDRNFHADLLSWLNFHQCMLIGELVPLTLQYFRNNPTADELCTFEYVVVDEYQDLNRAEQELLRLLSRNGSLFVVGDHNQSIYSFRYAHPEGIIEFDRIYPSSYSGTLNQCRRCPIEVINIANSLIQNNHIFTYYQELLPLEYSDNGEVFIIQWNSIEEEIQELSNYVEHLVDIENYNPGDIIILSPRRLIGYGVRDKLRERDIPVHSFYHEELLESDEAQISFSYLNLLVNRNDRVSLRFLLGEGSQTFLFNQYEKIRDYCESTDEEPWGVMEQIVNNDLSIDGVRKEIKNKFKEISNRLTDLNELETSDLIEELFPSSEEWSAPILESLKIKIDQLDEDEEIEPSDVLSFIKNVVTQPEMPEAGEFVRVMSLHKSKGLTSKVVIIAGCIEGLIPTIDRDLPQREKRKMLEEQRRLFYVAITRAKEVLVISSSRRIRRALSHKIGAMTRRGGGGAYAQTLASRFISELGPDAPESIRGIDWRENNYDQ